MTDSVNYPQEMGKIQSHPLAYFSNYNGHYPLPLQNYCTRQYRIVISVTQLRFTQFKAGFIIES